MPATESNLACNFGIRLRQMRNALGLSQNRIAEAAGGWRIDTWSRIERGGGTGIQIEMICGIADFAARCGVSLAWLFADYGHMFQAGRSALGWEYLKALSRDDLVVELGRLVSDQGIIEQLLKTADSPAERKKVVAALEPANRKPTAPKPQWKVTGLYEPGFHEVDRDELPARWRGSFLPVIGRLSAGQGVDTVEAEAHAPGWADSFLAFDGAPAGAFALRVVGDSMEPDYRDGDMVIVDPARTVDSGAACVLVDEDGERRARLKILSKKGRQVFLLSKNPKHPSLKVSPKKLIAAYEIIKHLPRVVERKRPWVS